MHGSSTCSYHDPARRSRTPPPAPGPARQDEPIEFATKELSERTWDDFETFFAQGTGWGRCGCLFALDVRRPPRRHRTWAQQRADSLATMHGLVGDQRSHGVLVYDDATPVGWCQFVRKDELRLKERATAGADWFITCFVVDPRYRGRGVTSVALRAALEAIIAKGGGIVEGIGTAMVPGPPPTRERQDPHVDGDVVFSTGVARLHFRYELDGVGPVTASYRSDRSMHGAPLGGTVELFAREGFTATEVIARPPRRFSEFMPDRVVMRRTVESG